MVLWPCLAGGGGPLPPAPDESPVTLIPPVPGPPPVAEEPPVAPPVPVIEGLDVFWRHTVSKFFQPRQASKPSAWYGLSAAVHFGVHCAYVEPIGFV